MRRADKEYFLSKCVINPVTGCIEWCGSRNYSGYGYLSGGRAHRFSWELYVGKIPTGLCVLHKCDNPSCVNPNHLWLGTHAENMKDRLKKNRYNALKLNRCKNGHVFNKKNTMVLKRKDGRIERICKPCRYAYKRKYESIKGRKRYD